MSGIIVIHLVPLELRLVIKDMVHGMQHLALEFYFHCHGGFTCLEGQPGVRAVDAPEGFAHKLLDAAPLGLDVFEGDLCKWIAQLVNELGTFKVRFIVVRMLKESLKII